MPTRIVVYGCYGIALLICIVNMVVNYRRKMQHLAPDVSRSNAMRKPGDENPDLYTAEGNRYRERESAWRYLCIALVLAWAFADQWLVR